MVLLANRIRFPRTSPDVSSRVVLWALVAGPDVVDHVIGIDVTGVPQDDPFTEVHYLCGADISSNGSAWSSVYRNITASLHQVREVTHLFAD